jgi:uncharacterized membrane protein YjgN (DUF898 family)
MSFGQLQFRANLTTEGLKWRWALVYLVPLAALVVIGFIAVLGIAQALGSGAEKSPSVAAAFLAFIALIYLAIPLTTLNFFAAFYRKAAAATKLGDLELCFDASTWDWLKLVLGTLGLVIITLGFGLTYAGYRNWAFMVRHMHIYGTIDVAALTQSTTRAPIEAEGWADAFDVGAI